MKVIVIGGGLLGVTTAYFLQRRGYQVTVIERQTGAGMETSFANGAMLTPSMPEPWNAPGCWRVLLSSLVKHESPMQLRLKALPSLMGWGIRFLKMSKRDSFERSVQSNLRLALHSLAVMHGISQETQIKYGRGARGTLRIFRDASSLQHAVGWATKLQSAGLPFKILSQVETVALEPALAPIAYELAGALHYAVDETGDAHKFCRELGECARRIGVEFRFGTEIQDLEVRNECVHAALSRSECFVGDKYVIAAGSYSGPLLRRAGLSLPVAPVKGYSITMRANDGASSLKVPVIDDQLHAAVVPLEHRIRVAGTAEFAGYDCAVRPDRIRNLLRLLRGVLPTENFDLSTAAPWCGLRPVSVDGVPVIGLTPLHNVFVNTGHGHLGWTMAAGSGELLAELVAGENPSLDPAAFAFSRFTRSSL